MAKKYFLEAIKFASYMAKEWIQTQREQLALRLEEDSLPKVEDLLAGSLMKLKR